MMNATAKYASHLSLSDPRRHFTMLLAISVPIMALYTAGAIDYANMLMKDQPTEVSVELSAPARMAEAMKTSATLLDTPALAFAAPYATPSASARMPFGDTTLASAAANASLASY